ncbi:FecCD family ABC transporter permease [Halalkalibacillus halophilus]|uniref:FecCD family ABC transporter permease n=1 Tax=Halalkalibacillus halophilus TaxID=392827 RepID=UPI000428F4E2|nr:iron ABC transporter permease [Halalkalibacillus halophilus]
MNLFQRNQSITFIVAVVALVVAFVGAIVFGAADIRLADVAKAFFTTESNENILIIREIRLPREVAAMVVGAALAVSGAIMQGLTRNPLADPGLFGLTAGATAGLAIMIAFFPATGYIGIMIGCFLGAAVGAILVFGIGSAKRGGFSPFRIVLAGAAVSTFLYAIAEGIGIYFKISKDVSMWTAGGLIGTNWTQLSIVVPVIVIGCVVAIWLSRQLSILSLDEELSVGLGQRTTQIKTALFIVIVLLAGASVALVGNLVFIGLMIPHIVRWIIGTDYRMIIPMSVIVGATFMLVADTAARTLNAPYETPLAAITSFIGLPFFLYIIHKGGRTFS